MFDYTLTHIADEELLSNTQSLVEREREITLEVLQYLREIERRRLFSSLGYSSLFDYCTEHLKYSGSAAQRRIQSMRALRDLPEIADKIETGSLSLSTLSQAQGLFTVTAKKAKEPDTSIQKYSNVEKLELIQKLENKSARAVQKLIAEEAQNKLGQLLPTPEVIRPLNQTQSEMKLTIDKEFEGKLNKLKGLLAHKMPGATTQELLNHVMDLAIEKLDPANKPRNGMKKRIWLKAKSKCEICQSQYFLESDHIRPRAKGGTNEEINFRLLCRNCNQRQAIEKIGEKVIQHWDSP